MIILSEDPSANEVPFKPPRVETLNAASRVKIKLEIVNAGPTFFIK